MRRIKEILNHLDKLSLDRIENMEDNIKGLGKGRVIIQQDFNNLETELQETRARVAKLKRKQLGQNNKISLARFMIANLEQILKNIQAHHQADKESSEGAVGLFCWFERTESVFSVAIVPKSARIEKDYNLSWIEFKKLLIKKYCLGLRRTFINNNYRNTNTNNRYNNYQPQHNQRQEAVRAYAVTPAKNNGYNGNSPLCKKCTLHHTGPFTAKCNTCNKVGHLTKNCRNKGPATGSNLLPVTDTCHAYEEKGHYANQCRKTANNNAHGRSYMLRDRNAHQTQT
uniref:Reverse transcriptase domain-containing protein n=1 Tax=Tanacetum cinerariifolium TaxID=118510 RepID=A0A699IK96_TANCI|nr:reverse transcriptase domain-containing protein [Tanacetum cinerariifolium]